MDAQIAIPDWLIVMVGSALLAYSLIIYGKLARQLFATGGKVSTDKIAPQDMGLALGLSTLFIFVGMLGFFAKAHRFHLRDILTGSLPSVFLTILIGAFLLSRRLNLVDFFGLRSIGFFKAAGIGIWMQFAALPIVLAVVLLTQLFFHERAEPQEIVKFFLEASHSGNKLKIGVVLMVAVLLAPACEEPIFRGYIYPVFKRYLGMWPAIFFNAALFGLIHANLASLPALVALAVCLTVAYETTGSLAVPYVMHATFNLCQLGMLLCTTFMTK